MIGYAFMRLVPLLLAATALFADVPTPESVLGHKVGEDFFLASYDESLAYFQKLAASTDKLKLVKAGKTTQGRDWYFAIISSASQLELSHAEETAFRRHLSADSSWLRPIIASGAVKGISSEEDVARFARTLASQTVVNGAKVLSAACIVFGHSIVDDIFSDSCAFAIECDPKGWAEELDPERRIALREIRELGADGVLQKELKRLAVQLREKSLPNRAGILFRHAPIAQHSQSLKSDPDYFRLSTLKKLDELRHDIVHRGGVSRVDVSKTVNYVGFLQEAASTAVRTLCNKYACGIQNEYLEEMLKRSPP